MPRPLCVIPFQFLIYNSPSIKAVLSEIQKYYGKKWKIENKKG